jgi:hypothetical protein
MKRKYLLPAFFKILGAPEFRGKTVKQWSKMAGCCNEHGGKRGNFCKIKNHNLSCGGPCSGHLTLIRATLGTSHTVAD